MHFRRDCLIHLEVVCEVLHDRPGGRALPPSSSYILFAAEVFYCQDD